MYYTLFRNIYNFRRSSVMKERFLTLSPQNRLAHMTQLVHRFGNMAACLHAPFTILVYGSTSYGLNLKHYGYLDDIDIFLIIPRKIPAEEILWTAQDVFETELDIPIEHLQELRAGSWEICRMYGNVEGVKVSFRIMCKDIFASLATSKGSTSTVRNVATVGFSRIIVDVEWSIKLWKYVPIELSHSIIKHKEGDLLFVKHHLLSVRKIRLGALGRKLLTSKVVYDPSGQAQKIIKEIWRLYVQACLKYHPRVSTTNIINSVLRSEKFSSSFRRRLARIICAVR